MRGGPARALLLVLALTGLTLAGGCIFVDANFAMAPDGSTQARMEAGVLKSIAEQGEGDFTTDVSENLVAENWTELEAFERGQWQVQAWEGQAGPGERLFVEGDAPAPEFGVVQHTLSTVYTFDMPLPEGPVAGPTEGGEAAPEPEPQPEEEGEVEVEGMEQMGAAVGEMMAMMMTTGDAGLRFSVDLPGELVETNGAHVSPGKVAWGIDLTAEEPPVDRLLARSRLPNWPVVGRLGGQMAEMGRPELVSAMIAGARRGVLPDPVSDDPSSAELDTLMYVQAVEIMMALDDAVGEQNAAVLMGRLGLTGDADPATVEEVAERLEGLDLGAEIDEAAAERALELLGG
ncbi:MAG: hypothetical protein ACLFU7_08415 [Armatimonadota bacterium]